MGTTPTPYVLFRMIFRSSTLQNNSCTASYLPSHWLSNKENDILSPSSEVRTKSHETLSRMWKLPYCLSFTPEDQIRKFLNDWMSIWRQCRGFDKSYDGDYEGTANLKTFITVPEGQSFSTTSSIPSNWTSFVCFVFLNKKKFSLDLRRNSQNYL